MSGKTVDVPKRVRCASVPIRWTYCPVSCGFKVELAQVFAAHLSVMLASARPGSPAGWRRSSAASGAADSPRTKRPTWGAQSACRRWCIPESIIEVSRSAPGRCAAFGRRCRLVPSPSASVMRRARRSSCKGRSPAAVRVLPSAGVRSMPYADLTLRTPLVVDAQLRVGEEVGWGRLVTSSVLRVAAAPGVGFWGLPRASQSRARALWPVSSPIWSSRPAGFPPSREVLGFSVGDIVMLDHFGPRPITGGPVWLRLGRGCFPVTSTGPASPC